MMLYLTRYEVLGFSSKFGLTTKVDWEDSGWRRYELSRSTRDAAVPTMAQLLGGVVHSFRPRAFLRLA
jgi:hypothetical protein